ncbi:MAG: hypothetical protein JXR37_29605 [Kiritimatiellae bacterium]|nr:hypothetical protein [Kiritimatiellia bacterium]
MKLDQFLERKRQHRHHLATLPFERKIAVLIKMQEVAREMATASGRPFKGAVWGRRQQPPDSSRAPD